MPDYCLTRLKSTSKNDSATTNNPTNKNAIIFFFKYPQLGTVKTRLAKDLGDTFTLSLYKCFLRDMLSKLTSPKFDTHLLMDPGEKIPAMRRQLEDMGYRFPIHPQIGNDMGERMKNAFEVVFSQTNNQQCCQNRNPEDCQTSSQPNDQKYGGCLLIGSDFPDLPVWMLEEAFNHLETADSVLGPTMDGGYYLIGFRRETFYPEAFQNIRWSTDTVFQNTLNILRKQQNWVTILRRWADVDEPHDLDAFFKRNREGKFGDSFTMALLEQHLKAHP